ncbi:MAG: hypothetical protein IJJ38_00325 [Lachnospiraceae bacterium]|nr:hypothetical protein [Lachnospiraceae bacterium]
MTFQELAEMHLKSMEQELNKLKLSSGKSRSHDTLLACEQNGNYVKWFQVSVRGGRVRRTYLPKRQKKLAEQLALNSYRDLRQRELEIRIPLLKHYLESCEKSEKKLARLEKRSFLIHTSLQQTVIKAPQAADEDSSVQARLTEWKMQPFPSSPPHPEARTVRSVNGLMVRSKSEDIIASELTRCGIPFHYEESCEIGGKLLHPDFCTLHPVTEQPVLWEHFGLMDDPEYAQQMIRKLSFYHANGYTPGVNLIFTTEAQDVALNSAYVRAVIAHYYGVEVI